VALSLTVASLAGAAPALGSIYAPRISFPVNEGAQDDGIIGCADANQLIGAGFESNSTGVDNVYLNTLQPMAPNVQAYADNYFGGSGNLNPEVQAVCDSEGEAGDYPLVTLGPHPVLDGSEVGFVAKCPSGDPVIGGGVLTAAGFTAEAYVSSLGPVDRRDRDRLPDDGWLAEVHNRQDAGGASVQVTAYAICDAKHERLRYRSFTKSPRDGALNGPAATCRGGQTLVGGGLVSSAQYRHAVFLTDSSLTLEGTWLGQVQNHITPDGKRREVTVTAICLKP
jgi:hypothetical protein